MMAKKALKAKKNKAVEEKIDEVAADIAKAADKEKEKEHIWRREISLAENASWVMRRRRAPSELLPRLSGGKMTSCRV